MQFVVEMVEVRPIKALRFEIDLERNQLLCIVGKSGSGKTTLVKSILNFTLSDTLARTAPEGIVQRDSRVLYRFGEQEFLFTYDESLRMLNTRVPVPAALKAQVLVELPMPYGHRFNFFRTLSESDHEIRRAIILGDYRVPVELIAFLTRIYGERRFDAFVEIELRGGSCCCVLLPDGRYLREDYFSSGEYSLISLFRKVRKGARLLVVDEIDISLDARAQARLAAELRELCAQHGVNIVVTSHSLAMMQTLGSDELLYMDRAAHEVTFSKTSFSYVKSLMFGFSGRDRYILTEDPVLKAFLEYLIRRYCPPSFYSYHLIDVGGAYQVVDLMIRNEQEEFLGPSQDVISILDGDQQSTKFSQSKNVYCIPLESVEKALWTEHERFACLPSVAVKMQGPKALYKYVIREKILSSEEIFALLCDRHDAAMLDFSKTLQAFLCRPEG
ncbi:AAA family ATPase [Achromobacter sp. PAB15]|uniref:AAA family ATPase n=1 Tax=Achromobacter sp. PAB15 TaxID=3233048 RepID=UPI003F900A2B